MLVAFGEPVPLGPHVARAREEPVAAVQGLTDAIQSAMEAEVVHVDRIDVAEVVRAVEELYRDELVRQLRAERGLPPEAIDVFRLSRAIVEAVAHFRAHDPERVGGIWQRIQHYRALLAEWHVRDQAVRSPAPDGRASPPPPLVRARPCSAFRSSSTGPSSTRCPYLIPRWLARAFARKETDYATIRLLSSVVAFPLCWGLETWLVWRRAGAGWALAFAVSCR